MDKDARIKELEEENEKLKEHLKKYTAPSCKKAYYEKNKEQILEKGFSTMELTGCELPFLKGYIEGKFVEGMTWENHGSWHLDYVRPCCSFDLTQEEEQKKCFHYTNLQPLFAKENLSKGGKYEASIEN